MKKIFCNKRMIVEGVPVQAGDKVECADNIADFLVGRGDAAFVIGKRQKKAKRQEQGAKEQ